VGAEVIVKYLYGMYPYDNAEIIVIGDLCCIADAIKRAKLPMHVNCIKQPSEASAQPYTIDLYDLSIIRPGSWEYKKISALNGRASFSYLEAATTFALNGEVDALITMPISKRTLKETGYLYTGNTDILADLTESREYSNMLINERLRVMQVTNHLPLKDVIERITEERVYKTIMHAHNATIMCGIKTPKIVVCGINPHASPGCIFGREDEEIVLPAINRANTHGMNVCGPVDASTAFTLAYLGQFDVIITMYHDQGNPAFMLASIAAAGDSNSQTHYACGTNMTYGLPFIRTSVNFDERFDIAGDGKADPSELKTAVECTLKLIKYNQHI